jgi:nitric oxide reductase NorQ protein
VHAGRLIGNGVSREEAVGMAIVLPLTDDPDVRAAISDSLRAIF